MERTKKPGSIVGKKKEIFLRFSTIVDLQLIAHVQRENWRVRLELFRSK